MHVSMHENVSRSALDRSSLTLTLLGSEPLDHPSLATSRLSLCQPLYLLFLLIASSAAQATPLSVQHGCSVSADVLYSWMACVSSCSRFLYLFSLLARAVSLCWAVSRVSLIDILCTSFPSIQSLGRYRFVLLLSLIFRGLGPRGYCHFASQVDSISFWLMGFLVIKMERYSLSLIFRLRTSIHHQWGVVEKMFHSNLCTTH